jgi:hypothetical protein
MGARAVDAPSGTLSGATAYAEGPPAGHTGGFGEPTCQACHTEYALNLQGGSLNLEGWPEPFEPGRAYTLTVVLDAEGMALAGFQLAVRDPDGRQAGRLRPVDNRVAVVDSGGVSYAQQTEAGSRAGHARTVRWQLEWTAPEVGPSVEVHVAANSANGDDSPFGDLVYADRWSAARGSTGGQE